MKQKILKLKIGYNPNSSSMELAIIYLFVPSILTAIISFITSIVLFLNYRR